VEEAAKHEAEDKARFERVEAKNQLESYLYNARNSLQEEKVKEKLGEEATTTLTTVQEGITWLDAHQEEEKETYVDYQKSMEDKIRPVMMKLYADAGAGAGQADPTSVNMADFAKASASAKGPKIEEVD
jgi:L1 cell adhesion molecule like protein